jgi:uridine kinase
MQELNLNNDIDYYVSDPTERQLLKDFVTKTQNGDKVVEVYVLHGDGGNGKTTFLDKLIDFIGKSQSVLVDINKFDDSYNSFENKKLVVVYDVTTNDDINKLFSTSTKNKLTTNCCFQSFRIIDNTVNYITSTTSFVLNTNIIPNNKNNIIPIHFDKKFICQPTNNKMVTY